MCEVEAEVGAFDAQGDIEEKSSLPIGGGGRLALSLQNHG